MRMQIGSQREAKHPGLCLQLPVRGHGNDLPESASSGDVQGELNQKVPLLSSLNFKHFPAITKSRFSTFFGKTYGSVLADHGSYQCLKFITWLKMFLTWELSDGVALYL